MSKLFETKTVWKIVDEVPQKCTLLTPAKGKGYMLFDQEGACVGCSQYGFELHDVYPTKERAIQKRKYDLEEDIKRNERWKKESIKKLAALTESTRALPD